MFFLLSTALAAPDHVAATWKVGTEVFDIGATEDGAFVAWVETGAGTLTVLDAGIFSSDIYSICTDARGLAITGDSDKGYTFFVGCGDGTVAAVDVTPDGEGTIRTDTWSAGSGPVSALETDGSYVYAVVSEESGTTANAISATDGSAVDGWPVTLLTDAVEDSALMSGYLVVSNGTEKVSKVSTSSPKALLPSGDLGSRNYADMYPYATSTSLYLADTGGGLVKFQISDSDYISSLTAIADTVTAVALDEDEGWMLLGAGDEALLYDFSGGPGEELDSFSAADLQEIAVIPGYALAATEAGQVLVMTDAPWVTIDSLSPSSAVSGDEVSLTFDCDVDGTYEVRVGGTVDDPGDVVKEGDVSANESVTVDFTVDSDTFAEGDNRIWVFVTANGITGRAGGTLTVDNPPGKVQLGESDVGFGNGAIHVSFTGLDVSDIDHYTIYIDVEPFVAADFETGGPGFTGTDEIDTPITATGAAGATISREISPLTNGTTYYVAVRAIDESGQEGPMSNVQSATPEETYCAACLAGDEGSWFPGVCGTTRTGGVVATALALALASVRRRGAMLGAFAVAGLAVAAPPARAADDDTESPRTMGVQLRYGPITVTDPYVQQVFGDDANEILWFEYGYVSRFVEANLGLGFYQELAFLQTAEGAVSDEHDMFTMFPITLSVTGRLDIFKEQPIVPFARVGADYWMWRENWYVSDPDAMEDVRDGGKYGWHYGGGLLIRLDALDRRAASRLEASSGINDTFLAAEYRATNLVHGKQQLNLSSSEITFGLKFDF